MRAVPVAARSLEGLQGLAKDEDLEGFRDVASAAADRLRGHTVWHVNSTSAGGGVAELLHQLLGYLVGREITTRWMVVDGEPAFFGVTKRIHNRLHGVDGDPLGQHDRDVYTGVLREEAGTLLAAARPGDVAVLHDPQTAGLAPPLVEVGVRVVWVSHIGVDVADDVTRSAWDFLLPHVEPAHAYVFSRKAYVWDGLEPDRSFVIPPCIDPTSAKNADLTAADVGSILAAAGVVGEIDEHELSWGDDTTRIRSKAEVIEKDPTPPGAPVVTQVSRWDRLKDPLGVLRGFRDGVDGRLGAHLLLVGPNPGAVSDDPEGAEVFEEVHAAWRELPDDARERVHLVNLAVDDRIENALVVNAIQRRSDIVVQKSIAEGFGLTVAEAMWKGRPVVGGRVGGIQDQIVDGESGLLVDPRDPIAMGNGVESLLGNPVFADAIGHASRARVRDRFLPPHFLGAHLQVALAVFDPEA